jgi:hypothetical protein
VEDSHIGTSLTDVGSHTIAPRSLQSFPISLMGCKVPISLLARVCYSSGDDCKQFDEQVVRLDQIADVADEFIRVRLLKIARRHSLSSPRSDPSSSKAARRVQNWCRRLQARSSEDNPPEP